MRLKILYGSGFVHSRMLGRLLAGKDLGIDRLSPEARKISRPPDLQVAV